MNAYENSSKMAAGNLATFHGLARAGFLGASLALLLASPCVLAEDAAGAESGHAIGQEQQAAPAPVAAADAAASRPAGKPSRALVRARRELLEGMTAFQDLLVRDPATPEGAQDGEFVAVQWHK